MNESKCFGSIISDSVRNTRKQLLEKTLNNGEAICLLSPMMSYQDIGIPMEYSPSTNIAYLTGYQGPDVALMAKKKDDKLMYHLYVNDKVDSLLERFNGKVPNKDELKGMICVDEVTDLEKLATDINTTDYKMKLYGPGNVSPEIDKLRMVKDEFELEQIRAASKITCNSMEAAMKKVKVMDEEIRENHIRSSIEHEMLMRGARGISFPTVISSKNTDKALHNVFGNKPIGQGMFLVDAGAKTESLYCSDITKVYPDIKTGKYTSEEEDILNVVTFTLEALENTLITAMKSKKPLSLNDLDSVAQQSMGRWLVMLGIIDPKSPPKSKIFFHSVAHHIGMSVHDCTSLSANDPLSPGCVICLEPGLYLQGDEGGSSAAKYANISCRLEKMYILKEDGIEKLTE